MPTPSDPDGLLDRIRKLLAKAENPAVTAEEADAYNAKAAELIARYGVDRALLAVDSPESDRPGDRIIALDPPYARDKAGLLWAVAAALGCRAVRRESSTAGRRVFELHLFGMDSDLERTDLLYTSLLVQAAHGLAVSSPRYGEDVRAYRRSWYAGFAGAVHRRLVDAERAARLRAERSAGRAGGPGGGRGPGASGADAPGADASGADASGSDGPGSDGPGSDGLALGGSAASRSLALVLADRAELVDRRLAEAYPRTTPSRPRALTGTGASAGFAAGQRADLGGTRLGRSDPQALR
jgi:hypothetical protein